MISARLAHTAGGGAEPATLGVWRFDGARCARVLAYVLATIEDL